MLEKRHIDVQTVDGKESNHGGPGDEEYAAMHVEKHRLMRENLRWLDVSYWTLAGTAERDSSP
jgi:hypothetical protein